MSDKVKQKHKEANGVQPGHGRTEAEKAQEGEKAGEGTPSAPQAPPAEDPAGAATAAGPGGTGAAETRAPTLGKLNPETGERAPLPQEDEGTHPLF